MTSLRASSSPSGFGGVGVGIEVGVIEDEDFDEREGVISATLEGSAGSGCCEPRFCEV